MRVSRDACVNAGLVFASCLFAALLLWGTGELVLRSKYGSLRSESELAMRTFDERRGWALRPGNYSYFDPKSVRRVDLRINELGLRNAPLAPAPLPGVRRVTLLGDSFIFGAPVAEDATIAAQLQALAGSAHEIVNVGVPGYGTGQEYLLVEELRAKGYELGAKLVLVFFTNDILDNLGLEYGTLQRNAVQPVFGIDANGNLRLTPGRPPRKSWAVGEARGGGLLGESLFLGFMRYQLEVVAVSFPGILAAAQAVGIAPALPRTPGVIAGWYGPQWEARWQVTSDLVEYLVGALRRTSVPPEVYIAFIPSPFQVHESFRRTVAAAASSDERCAGFLSDPDRPQRVLEALARRLEVPFVDLTPALRSAAERATLYFPREGHFNEAGSAIAAQVLYEQVIAKER